MEVIKIMKIDPVKDRLYNTPEDKEKRKNENLLFGDQDKEKNVVNEKDKKYKKNTLNETVGTNIDIKV